MIYSTVKRSLNEKFETNHGNKFEFSHEGRRTLVVVVVVVVVLGSVRQFSLDVGHLVGPLNYSRCDTRHRLP